MSAWSIATFTCGRCGHTFTATTEDQYVIEHVAHKTVHQLLDAASPETRARLIELALAEVAGQLT